MRIIATNQQRTVLLHKVVKIIPPSKIKEMENSNKLRINNNCSSNQKKRRRKKK